MFVFWWVEVRRFWVPAVDEFPLLVSSAATFHPHPLHWLTQGYSKYFVVYPELTNGQTNFLRPVGNLFYFVSSLLCGQHWVGYLLCAYVVYALLAAGTVWIAVRYFGFSALQVTVLGVLLFFTPAQDPLANLYPDGALDLLGATLLMWSLAFLFKRRLGMAFVLCTAAVFTKETTHFAPFAMCVCLYLFSPRPLSAKVKAYLCAFPLPVIALYTLRRMDFRSNGGVYATGGISLRSAAKSVLRWPLHIFVDDAHPARRGVVIGLERYGLVACCALFWVLLLGAGVPLLLRAYRAKERAVVEAEAPVGTAILFLAGALCLPVLLGLTARFGALVFPLLALLGVYFVGVSGESWRRYGWAVCVVALAVVSVQARLGVFASMRSNQKFWEGERGYLEAIQGAPAGVLLSVDDRNGGTTVRWLQAFTRYSGVFVPVDRLMPLGPACWQFSKVERTSAEELRVEFPYKSECQKAVLEGTNKAQPAEWSTATGPVTVTYFSDGKAQLQYARVRVPAGIAVSVLEPVPYTNQYRVVDAASLPDSVSE